MGNVNVATARTNNTNVSGEFMAVSKEKETKS